MLIHFWLKRFEKKKHVGDRIILNLDVSKDYDFYTVKIKTGEKDDDTHYVKGYSSDKIQTLKYDGSAFTVSSELNPNDLKPEDFSVTHYYKDNEFSYCGLRGLYFKNSYHKLTAIMGNSLRAYAQYRFNKKTLFMKDRLEILGVVLNEFFNDDIQYGISSVSVMNSIYSTKWLFHPESTSLHNRITFYLNSLVASGDLKVDGMGNYFAQPRALETLEKYRHENNREQRDKKIKYWTLFWSILAVFFTFFSAWGTLVQAGILPKWEWAL